MFISSLFILLIILLCRFWINNLSSQAVVYPRIQFIFYTASGEKNIFLREGGKWFQNTIYTPVKHWKFSYWFVNLRLCLNGLQQSTVICHIYCNNKYFWREFCGDIWGKVYHFGKIIKSSHFIILVLNMDQNWRLKETQCILHFQKFSKQALYWLTPAWKKVTQ